ncbi:MAG: suhB1 [Rhodocyclaceae bacterium]|nr:suhB1 [Rhodocyclaceae bacterium]
MNYDPATLLPRVEALVRTVAAREIMPRFLQAVREHKSDGSALSDADLASQRFLNAELGKLVPLPILGEEMDEGQQRAALAAGDDGLWCVDPVDGTTNFLAGLPFFAVSVALLRQGKPILGVSYAPFCDEMFTALAGGGARLNGELLPLRRPESRLDKSVALVDLKRLPKPLALALAGEPPYYSQRNLGSSVLEWCYLAAGRADLLLHGGQRPWDYAAGRLMVAEAGGSVSSFELDDFDAAPVWRRSVIAALDPAAQAAWRAWTRGRL